MELILKRSFPFPDAFTEGKLYVADEFVCDTLEPPFSGLSDGCTLMAVEKAKKAGFRAIPSGRYNLILSFSPRFSGRNQYKLIGGGLLPLLCAVTGFSGVRIHVGNTVADTDGCILVGRKCGSGVLARSLYAYRNLMQSFLLPTVQRGEKVFVRIVGR